MPRILKARRIHNSGKKKKKRMTAKQIRFFGTKRQRAALKNRPKRKNKRRRNFPGGSRIYSWSRGRGKRQEVRKHRNPKRRRRNVGEILTASLSGLNPGRKKMAKTKRRSRRHRNAGRRRTRRSVARVSRRRRRSNPRVVVRYRSRRHNRRRAHRNPGTFFSGKIGKVVGVLGGAAVTSLISANFIPAQFNTGIMGYFASGIVAFAQGKLIGKVAKNNALGDDMVIGGLAYVVLRVINDMLPSIAGYLPFKLNGLGLIAPSSFPIPQVNLPGSMSQFVVPAGAPVAALGPGMHGLGATRGRRVGRMGY